MGGEKKKPVLPIEKFPSLVPPRNMTVTMLRCIVFMLTEKILIFWKTCREEIAIRGQLYYCVCNKVITILIIQGMYNVSYSLCKSKCYKCYECTWCHQQKNSLYILTYMNTELSFSLIFFHIDSASNIWFLPFSI